MSASECAPLTLPPPAIAISAALACAGRGKHRVQRQLAMPGDPMSQLVLSGIVLASLSPGSAPLPILLATTLAATLSAGLITAPAPPAPSRKTARQRSRHVRL